MATLTVTIGIASADATSESLSLGAAGSLSVEQPMVSPGSVSVLHTAPTNILTAAANTADTYVFAKNTDETNFVEGKDDAGNVLMQLNPGEFTWLTVQGGIGFELQADTGACVVEYGYWTKS